MALSEAREQSTTAVHPLLAPAMRVVRAAVIEGKPSKTLTFGSALEEISWLNLITALKAELRLLPETFRGIIVRANVYVTDPTNKSNERLVQITRNGISAHAGTGESVIQETKATHAALTATVEGQGLTEKHVSLGQTQEAPAITEDEALKMLGGPVDPTKIRPRVIKEEVHMDYIPNLTETPDASEEKKGDPKKPPSTHLAAEEILKRYKAETKKQEALAQEAREKKKKH